MLLKSETEESSERVIMILLSKTKTARVEEETPEKPNEMWVVG